MLTCRVLRRHDRQLAGAKLQALLCKTCCERLIQRGNAVVIEARRYRAVHRHFVRRLLEKLAVALILLAHVAQRVGGALAIELVDGDEVGEVEHVDFLELARRTELWRHHIKRHIDMRHDRRVALSDTRSLDHDQLETRDFARGDRVGQRPGDFARCIACRQRAHVNARAFSVRMDRIHADAITQQRAARFSPRRVDRDDRDSELVVLVEAEAADELVGQRAFSRASRARDSHHRRLARFRHAQQFIAELRRNRARFEPGDHSRQRLVGEIGVAVLERPEVRGQVVAQVDVAGADDLVDHSLQPEALAVFRRKNARHAVRVQLFNLGGDDHAATAAEHLDVGSASLA